MPTPNATPKHRHVAVCPFPHTSHTINMLQLSRKIAASSPGVLFTFFTPNPTLAALKTAEEEGSIRIHGIESGLATGAPPPAHPLGALRSFLEVAPGSLRKGAAEAEEESGVKISCVLADGMMAFAGREIAEERGVKWVAMWGSSAGTLAAHMHTQQLRTAIGGPQDMEAHECETADQYIPGFPPIPIADLQYEIFADDDPVGRVLHLMSLHLPKASAVLIDSLEALEPAAANVLNSAFPDKFLFAGSFALTLAAPSAPLAAPSDPHGCLPWLDTHAPASVVYISFGSGLPPPLEEFASLSEALETARVPFLWSLPEKFASRLPVGFEERTTKSGAGKFVSWVPQTQVLGHAATGAHLTHCGWGSVMESIVAGVPMVCRPSRIADHSFDARMVHGVWGIGVEIEGGKMTKAAMEAALGRVLLGEEGGRARERIKELRRVVVEATHGSSASNMSKFFDTIAT